MLNTTMLRSGQEVIVPTIHTGGTTGRELEAQLATAYAALNVALQAIMDASPNGRDYFPQGDDAACRASREHESRIERIRSVRDEVQEIYDAVGDAPPPDGI